MSSAMFNEQNRSPSATYRTPISDEEIGYNAQRTTNRRSLSDKLRSIFRRDSPSPNRSASNDRHVPTKSARQSSLSPQPTASSVEAPHLQAPATYWPFGKKKSKTSASASATPASKTKMKGNRKTKHPTEAEMEISNPIFDRSNPTSIYGQNFVPRTPEPDYRRSDGLQPSSSFEVIIIRSFLIYRAYKCN